MQEKKNFNLAYLVLTVLMVLFLRNLFTQTQQVAEIPYSEFQKLLKEGRVVDLEISDNFIKGQIKDPKAEEKARFSTIRVDTELARDLEQYNVKYHRLIESTFVRDMLSWVMPLMIFYGVWYYLGKRFASKGGLGGGLMSVGKSKAKIYVETDVKTTFADVAGVDEAKEELKEVVNFLKDPASYGRLGAHMPKGVLLVGPPGTGKTLLAKAVAGEASVPFFSISGSEFVEMFVGVGAARVRDLFEQARLKAPCIIFIDELDSLGRARSSHMMSGGLDEKEQTLNQLLAELDGFDSKTGVILLAATNRPEILDPALLRAGRFDRQVLVDKPDKRGRVDILKVHAKKAKLAVTVDFEKIAAITPGFTGADLANLINEAAIIATRHNASEVGMDDFTAAIERIVAGLEKRNRILNPDERKIVAHHEMGHALTATALPKCDKVHKISIIPRGIGALGYTIQRPTEDRYLMTKEELMNKMAVLLGGRCAEELIFNHYSTGAADDLARATDIARAMVVHYGMIPDLGPVVYEDAPHSFLGGNGMPLFEQKRYSETTAREIDCAVKQLVQDAAAISSEILRKHRVILEDGAAQLLVKETLSDADLQELFKSMAKL